MSEKSDNLGSGSMNISWDLQRKISDDAHEQKRAASAKRSITKCAIERTAEKIGVWTLGAVFVCALVIDIMFAIGSLIIMIVSAFPILRAVFPFVLLTGFISLFLFMAIYGIYEEYELNRHICREIEVKRRSGVDDDT